MIQNFVSDMMKINFQMFGSRMKNGVRSKIGSTQVVTLENGRVGSRQGELFHKWTKLMKFINCHSDRSILSFSGWTSCCPLFSRAPRDQITTDKNAITKDWFSIFNITHPVSITVRRNLKIQWRLKEKTMRRSAFQVT